MSLIHEHCILNDDIRNLCVVTEKGEKYTLENKSGFRIQTIKVDGCFEQKEGEKRCDFLMKLESANPKKPFSLNLKEVG